MEHASLSVVVDGVKIPAVLTAPPEPIAGVLLIPGSMNSDVDGNYAPMFPGQPAMAPHVYKDLAQHLAAGRLAVLRFAKSGPGTGTAVIDKEAAGEKFKTFPQRVRVAAAFLAELRRRIPGAPSILAGHSEGAVVATLLAQEHSEAAGVVLLSGPSQPLLHMMARQQFESDRRAGKTTPDSEHQYRAALALIDDFVAERPLPQDLSGNPYAAFLQFVARPENASYLRSLERVDPAAELAKVRQPVLIVQGGRDASVSPENADMLRQVKPGAYVVRFPELQHMYKKVPEGLSPQESFAQNSESDPAVAKAIAAWIEALLKPHP